MLPVRFFTRVSDDGSPWPIVGASYLKAFLDAGLEVRAVSTNGILPNDFDATSHWHGLHSAFLPRDPMRDFFNVVCGFGDDFRQFYTEGKINIAITGTHHRGPNPTEIATLNKYTVVWRYDVEPLVGIESFQLKPNKPDDFRFLFSCFNSLLRDVVSK